MTTATPGVENPDALWSAQAHGAVPALATWGAAVIAARDPQVAGTVAVAIARALSAQRRVAVADLVGDLSVLTALLPEPDDDPHGIADSFRYGVSLNRIARPVDAAGSLFVLPSGTEAVAHEEIYRNERWRRLAGGFTQVGACLLVVASPDVPGFDDLVRYVGGLVRVGAQLPDAPADVMNVLSIETPEPIARAAARATDRARRSASAPKAERRSRALALTAVAGALVFGAVLAWPTIRDAVLLAPAAPANAPADTVVRTPPKELSSVAAATPASADPTARPDSLAPADTSAASTTTAVVATPAVRNPPDWPRAARYSVYVLAANTAASAVTAVERAARTAGLGDSVLGGVTVSPVTFGADGARWYRVTMGAFASRVEAESLLTTLRRRSLLGETSGSVISVPLAFEVGLNVAVDSAPGMLRLWRTRGMRPYPLRTASGRINVYVGAFESPDQATLFADSLMSLGFTPPLAFRIGRSSP
ncbi:MAG: SPOR domain-containing protein [Gemmatimonadaceae bacterium]|nr:SPOR domain-containing protein [Gemmatimonadaceae bacterium]